jgi:ribonucleoside-triphosphate reductase (thioredoxin)
MDLSQEILSEIGIFMKYAKYVPEHKRRETWNEICDRYHKMMTRKYPTLKSDISSYMNFIREKKILMSMRAAQFAGKPIDISPNRLYNCAFLHISDHRAFGEVMFLLLGGSGVGYSVQKKHIIQLPDISKPTKERRFLVDDSIQGWADAVGMLIKSYFGIIKARPSFDFRDIRPKGAMLVTSGGKAPGSAPLEKCLFQIRQILDSKDNGSKLTSLDCHKICCYIADAVLAGGIRRAALSCLFDFDDTEMLYCKSGKWYELNPELARCNNSAVILRHKIKKSEWDKFWFIVKSNRSGEPGFVFSNNPDYGFNPCFEISLRDKQFCNLTTVNVSNVKNEEDFYERCEAASFFGTLQAGFTDFHYLREGWQITTEKEALIGVSQTGVASFDYSDEILKKGAEVVVNTNKAIAELIGINAAARCTTIKPEGTASIVLGSSSGIHAWDNEYYIRRVRVGKNEAIYNYLKENLPELIEDDAFKPDLQAVISIPQKAPQGSILKENESALNLLERAKSYQVNWVRPGHRKGDNYNNVSITVNLKETEWDDIGSWIWSNKDYFSAISVLPEDLGNYIQSPFEKISKDQYEDMVSLLKEIDLSKIIEETDATDLKGEVACGGGQCELV